MARKFLTPIDLTGLELQNFKIQHLSDDPTSYGAGHTYYNSTHSEIRVNDGANWIPVGGSVESGTFAAIPEPGNAGRLYVASDTKILYLDNVSAWLQIGIGAASTDTLTNKTISGNDNTISAIANASLTNSSVTINGVTFNLGDDSTITAATPNALTIGTGLSGTSFDGSAGVTVAIDETVATVDGSQTFTNKTLGSSSALGADLDASSFTISNLAAPTNSGDAATKGYVDATAQGLSVLGSVVAASDADVPDFGFVSVVGGVTLLDGARVLLKNQSNPADNGIYIYTLTTTSLALSTAIADTDIKEGSYTLVEEGTFTTQGWIVTAYSAGASTWTQFSAAGEYTGGDGVDITGAEISAKTGDGIDIDGSGNITVDTTVVRKYTETITGDSLDDGATGTTSFPITHGLLTKDIEVAVYDDATGEIVATDITTSTTSIVDIGFAVAPTTAMSYRIVVHA